MSNPPVEPSSPSRPAQRLVTSSTRRSASPVTRATYAHILRSAPHSSSSIDFSRPAADTPFLPDPAVSTEDVDRDGALDDLAPHPPNTRSAPASELDRPHGSTRLAPFFSLDSILADPPPGPVQAAAAVAGGAAAASPTLPTPRLRFRPNRPATTTRSAASSLGAILDGLAHRDNDDAAGAAENHVDVAFNLDAPGATTINPTRSSNFEIIPRPRRGLAGATIDTRPLVDTLLAEIGRASRFGGDDVDSDGDDEESWVENDDESQFDSEEQLTDEDDEAYYARLDQSRDRRHRARQGEIAAARISGPTRRARQRSGMAPGGGVGMGMPDANWSQVDVTVGGSGGMLRRGTNNRRRPSMARRRNGEEEVVVVVPEEAFAASGLRPTNETQSIDPVVICSTSSSSGTSSATKKDREAETADGSDEPGAKRRRMSSNVKPADQSPPLTRNRPSFLDYTTLSPSAKLPTIFHSPKTHARIRVDPSNLVTYTFDNQPEYGADQWAQAVRANRAVPVECGVFYWEAEVMDAGVKGYMSVGWMEKGLKMNRLVGWDKGSWGWHADDGHTFAGRGTGDRYGPGWTKGDVVGCGIDFTIKRAFYTKNGTMLGHVFTNLGANLYPAIGLRSMGESLAVNFTGPFKFDIDEYARDIRDAVWRDVLAPPLPFASSSSDSAHTATAALPVSGRIPPGTVDPDTLRQVDLPSTSRLHDPAEKAAASWVLDYVRQHGHTSTHAALQRSMRDRRWLTPQPTPGRASRPRPSSERDHRSTLSDFANKEECVLWVRQRILDSDRLELPMALLDSALGPDDDLMTHRSAWSRLRVHSYLFLLRRAANESQHDGPEAAQPDSASFMSHSATDPTTGADRDDELDMRALRYAQDCVEASRTWADEERRLMSQATGLMALPPSQWPEDGVGGRRQREADAENICDHLREAWGLKAESYLEQSVQRTHTAIALGARTDPILAFFDMNRFLRDPEAFHGLSRRRQKRQLDEVGTGPGTAASVGQTDAATATTAMRGAGGVDGQVHTAGADHMQVETKDE